MIALARKNLPPDRLPRDPHWTLNALQALRFTAPARYRDMLAANEPQEWITDLAPWMFLGSPAQDAGYCSEAAGCAVLPFCQATEQDMIACFSTAGMGEPRVLVINPWAL